MANETDTDPSWWGDLPWPTTPSKEEFAALKPYFRGVSRADLGKLTLPDLQGVLPNDVFLLAVLFFEEVLCKDPHVLRFLSSDSDNPSSEDEDDEDDAPNPDATDAGTWQGEAPSVGSATSSASSSDAEN